MTGRSQNRMEGHRRRWKEGRNHGRSWNPMEGRADFGRIPWNFMESPGTLRKEGKDRTLEAHGRLWNPMEGYRGLEKKTNRGK